MRPGSYSPSWRLEERKAALDPGAVWAAIQKKVASRSAVVSALLFEVHAWTGFLHAFTHVSIHTTRMDGLLTSLVAVLIHASYSDAVFGLFKNAGLPLCPRVFRDLPDQRFWRADLPDGLRMFGRAEHPTPLGQAFAEYERIDNTMHLLSLVEPVDDTYRRRMNRQLTVQESRHRLAG